MPTYSYTINLNDQISNPMQRMAASGNAAYGRLNRGQRTLNNNVQQGSRQVSAFGGGISKLATIAAGFVSIQIGKTVLGWGADMEKTRISFQTLTGSVEKGNELFSRINQFANVTPFNNAVLQKSANTMLAFGVSLDKIMPNISMLGDVAQGDAQKMESLTLAFSQVQSQGKLMGQDLLQFINAGFNPLKIISEQTGKSMATLKDEMSKGGISAGMVAESFKIATSEGGMFYNMMLKQSETMGGKWSTLIGTIQNQVGGFVEANSALFKSLLDGLISATNWMFENINVVGTFIGVLGTGLAIYKAWIFWTKAQITWQTILNAVMSANPIGLIITGIAVLAAGLVYAWNKFDSFRGAVMGAWEVLKGFGTIIKDFVIARFKSLLSGIGALGSAVKALFNGEWGKAKELAKQGMKDLAGVDAKKNAYEAAKGLGENFKKGYAKGVAAGPIKNPLAVTNPGQSGALSATSGGAGSTINDSSAISSGVAGITGGGQRNTNVNISLGNLIESFSINTSNVTEGVEQMRDMVTEALLKVVNSSNKLSYQ